MSLCRWCLWHCGRTHTTSRGATCCTTSPRRRPPCGSCRATASPSLFLGPACSWMRFGTSGPTLQGGLPEQQWPVLQLTMCVTCHLHPSAPCLTSVALAVLYRFDNATLAQRKPALQAAQRFLMSSALTHKLQHLPAGADRARVAAEGCARITDTAAAHKEGARSNRTAGVVWGCVAWSLAASTSRMLWSVQLCAELAGSRT